MIEVPLVKPMKIITDIEELRKKNNNIDLYEAKSIIEKLEVALQSSEKSGIGLAAPQIGIHKNVAIIRINKDGVEENLDLVNPKVIERENGFTFFRESCLSLPGKTFNTFRFKEIFVKDDLHPAGLEVYGLAAVAVIHEIDHLDGILISDRTVGKNKIGRNDKCPCQSGLKFKKCHGR